MYDERSAGMVKRFMASSSAGQRDGKVFAVVDRGDVQGGKGARRVSFHSTFAEARAEAKRLNAAGGK